MHLDEVAIDALLVKRLLSAQFPQWSELPLERVASAGTDNAIYRLGEDMALRLPRIAWAQNQPKKEFLWLPKLAPLLPFAVPVPLGLGTPAEGCPWKWSIVQWLKGENATRETLADLSQAARDLAQFILALQKIDASDAPLAGEHNSGRGVPLAMRDSAVRASIAALNGVVDRDLAIAAWESALNAPVWSGSPAWLHGDLQSGNLLARQGRLSAVIDFGCLGAGDPACDLMVAWNLLHGESRKAFRDALKVDEATWARGRGWALSVALIALPYYWNTSPAIVKASQYTLNETLSDFERESGQG